MVGYIEQCGIKEMRGDNIVSELFSYDSVNSKLYSRRICINP
jgi:hypothetical protein